jgi:hypothetical protein
MSERFEPLETPVGPAVAEAVDLVEAVEAVQVAVPVSIIEAALSLR